MVITADEEVLWLLAKSFRIAGRKRPNFDIKPSMFIPNEVVIIEILDDVSDVRVFLIEEPAVFKHLQRVIHFRHLYMGPVLSPSG